MNIDIVYTINVHEKVHFLLKQLNNIIEHNVNNTFVVILNCNDHMYRELQNTKLPDFVYINQEIINKNRFHGSLTHGIVSNLKYALNNFIFKYFIVLSSRNLFYDTLNLNTLNNLQKKYNIDNDINNFRKNNYYNCEYNFWHWPSFKTSKLATHYFSMNCSLYESMHEGLVFSYNVCKNIIKFLNDMIDITNDTINFNNCVEEFALQTISMNEIDFNNREYGFIYIGNGSVTHYINELTKDGIRIIYKTIRI